jgi:hypothetical protein
MAIYMPINQMSLTYSVDKFNTARRLPRKNHHYVLAG